MPIALESKRTTFRDLHRDGFFILPNPWDIGGVHRLEKLGFKAIASTSAGFAWSVGREDTTVPRNEILAHLRTLCASTDLPVNADFEGGFAIEPDDVAANVRLAVGTGVAGLSIEDRNGTTLFDLPLAVERISASRRAIDETDEKVILVGRSEGFFTDAKNIDDTIRRLVAYADAGADCLYAPGVREPAHIEAIVKAVAPKPVNVLLMSADMHTDDLQALGVRRVSVGGRLAHAAWNAFDDAARMLAEQGRLPSTIFR